MEVSVPIADAIRGARKTVEIPEGTGSRKISVTIPPGVRNGSVIRFRRKEDPSEEIVILTRVAAHPFLSMSQKGLIVELPISVGEALQGSKVQVPTLDEPVLLTVEPGTQSGSEVRLKGKGVHFREGSRGDLFVRFMIRVPDAADAVGLKEKSAELEAYYGRTVRAGMPRTLLQI
jgi:DnaJ-class molecular chaperone